MIKLKEFVDRYYFSICTYFMALLPGFARGLIQFSDSPSYLDNTIFVAPFYGYIVDIFQFICGENNLKWIGCVQYAVFFQLLYFYLMKISRLLKFNNKREFVFIITLSVIYTQFIAVQTEAVAYPLFFAFLYYVLKTIKDWKFDSYLCVLLFAVLLCLMRQQYIFLFPLIFIVLVIFRKKIFEWKKTLTFATLIFSLLISLFATNTVNYIRFGKFIGPQLFGLNFVNTPAYLMKAEDVDMFNDEQTKKIFLSATEEMQKSNSVKNCDISKWQAPSESDFDEIAKNFKFWNADKWQQYYNGDLRSYEEKRDYNIIQKDNICINDSYKHFVDTYPKRFHSFLIASQKNGIHDLETVNKITTEIAVKLIKNNFIDWLKYYLVVVFIDFEAADSLFLLSIIILVTYVCVVAINRNYYTNLSQYISVVLALHLCNALFVSLISMPHTRYVAFTMSAVVSCLVLLLFNVAEIATKRLKSN